MIDDDKQQEAIDYVLGELSSEAAAAFENELASDAELRDFTWKLTEAYASLPLATDAARPGPELFSRVMMATSAGRRPIFLSALPWALAACLAIGLLVMSLVYSSSRRELAELSRRDAIAHLQIASLQAQVDAYAKASAIVVWSASRQRGLLQIQSLPEPEPGHDYQLWIIDPALKNPVSAGVVSFPKLTAGIMEFSPDRTVATAEKFAVSIEKTGGSTVPQGPIILAGQ